MFRTKIRVITYSITGLLLLANFFTFIFINFPTDSVKVLGEGPLGDSGFSGPVLFKISSQSVTTINTRDFYIGDGTSSISANASVSFAVDARNQNIRFGGYTSCNLDTDGSGNLVCGTDASGGGGGGTQIELKDVPGTYNTNVSSVSFDGGKFTITASGSAGLINLDWGSAGPASLSQAETVNSLWTFSLGASLSTGLEVGTYASISNTLFVDTGTNTMVGIGTRTPNSILHLFNGSNTEVLTFGDTSGNYSEIKNVGDEFRFVMNTPGADGSIWFDDEDGQAIQFDVSNHGLNIVGSVSQPGDYMNVATNASGLGTGDIFVIDSSGRVGIGDASPTTKLDVSGSASVSSDFEVGGTSSASLFKGSAFSGNPDCNDATDKLLWSGGLFTCGTLADADIPDAITVSGGTLNSNSVLGTWTTTATLTIGDGGDRIDINSDTWDVTNGAAVGFTSLTLDTAATGILLDTDGDGMLIIQGQSSGQDEDLRFNFDDTANEVTVTTTTAVDHLLFSGIGVSTSLNFEATGYASASKYFTLDLGAGALTNNQFGIDQGGFGQFVYRASGSEHTLSDEKTTTVSVASTSFNTFASRSLGYQFRGMTLKRIWCKTSTATSVVINLSSSGTSDADQLTCTTSGVFDDGSIANATINKGAELILERRAVVGESDFLTITYTFVPVRE